VLRETGGFDERLSVGGRLTLDDELRGLNEELGALNVGRLDRETLDRGGE